MAKGKKEVLIIIPAYNEGKTIGPVLDKLTSPPISDIADVLIMNDASSDDTKNVCESYGVNVVTHVFNLGYGNGLQVGYKYATQKGYDYVIQMDSDGQHDPSNVLTLYEELKRPDESGNTPDIVLGSRFVEGAISFPISFTKKIAMSLFRTMIKVGTGQKIMDPTTGLQGLNKATFNYYSGFSCFDDKYPDANMIIQMKLRGANIREIPAVMYERKEGTSMHSGIIKPIIYMFRMILSIIAVWVRYKVIKIDRGIK